MKASLNALLVFTLVLQFVAPAAQIGALSARGGNLQTTTDPKYRVGDVWEYTTRRGEEQSRLTIVKIDESSRLGIIIHVAVDGLTWSTCQGSPFRQQIPHMPFAKDAIDHSITRRVGSTRSLPNYEDGYQEWKKSFLDGHAGIYKIPVKDAVSVAETTWRTGMGCPPKP